MTAQTNINAWERAFFAGMARSSGSSGRRVLMQSCDPETCSRLRVLRQGEVTVVSLYRPELLAEDESARALSKRLKRLLIPERVRLLLNLRGVHYASSTMLSGLAGAQVRSRLSDSSFRLYNVEPLLLDAIRICRLDRFLHIHATEAAAFASCERL
jgi:anti-anti-sigma factor